MATAFLLPVHAPDLFTDLPPSSHICGVSAQFQQILQFHKTPHELQGAAHVHKQQYTKL